MADGRLNLFHFGYTQILANLPSQIVVDFGMSGNRGSLVQRGILPPGMPTTLTKKIAAMTAEVPKQLLTLHRAICSSSNLSPADRRAS